MITEDYVSFETAKLLKEKGFKHWCYKSYGDAVYHKGVAISFDEECELKSEGLENEIEYVEGGCLYDFGYDNRGKDANVWAAPTLQMAMKWLREVHKLCVTVCPSVEGYYWNEKWLSYASDLEGRHLLFGEFIGTFNSYEEACEAAIKYIVLKI